MSPIRGEEFTGRTVEEAIERGLHTLGRKRTEVDIEVLEKGKPANVLGMGGEDARVLLSFQDDASVEPDEHDVDEAEVPRHPVAARPPADDDEPPPAYAEELALGATILRELLGAMRVEAEVRLAQGRGEEGLEVVGPDVGALIGRGGENLVALQQVVSAITSKRAGRSVHVAVDVDGYRRRREEQLRELAARVAARVRSSGTAVTLEPMLAYERRVVHLAVQGQQGVRSESVGIEPSRRVIISSTAPGARGPFRSGGFRPRTGYGGGFGQRRPYGGSRPGGFRPRPDR